MWMGTMEGICLVSLFLRKKNVAEKKWGGWGVSVEGDSSCRLFCGVAMMPK